MFNILLLLSPVLLRRSVIVNEPDGCNARLCVKRVVSENPRFPYAVAKKEARCSPVTRFQETRKARHCQTLETHTRGAPLLTRRGRGRPRSIPIPLPLLHPNVSRNRAGVGVPSKPRKLGKPSVTGKNPQLTYHPPVFPFSSTFAYTCPCTYAQQRKPLFCLLFGNLFRFCCFWFFFVEHPPPSFRNSSRKSASEFAFCVVRVCPRGFGCISFRGEARTYTYRSIFATWKQSGSPLPPPSSPRPKHPPKVRAA